MHGTSGQQQQQSCDLLGQHVFNVARYTWTIDRVFTKARQTTPSLRRTGPALSLSLRDALYFSRTFSKDELAVMEGHKTSTLIRNRYIAYCLLNFFFTINTAHKENILPLFACSFSPVFAFPPPPTAFASYLYRRGKVNNYFKKITGLISQLKGHGD